VSKNKKNQTTTKGAATSILLIVVAVLIIGIILFSDKLKTDGMSLSEIIGGITTTEEKEITKNPSDVALDFLKNYETNYVEFKKIEIGNKTVYFYQRMIDDAIVEKDFKVYQFDKHNGKFLNKTIKWRDDLPEHSPTIIISKEEAESMVNGTIQFSKLYIISPESDVFPIKPTPNNPSWVVGSIMNNISILTIVDAITGEKLGYGIPPPYTAFSLTGPINFNPCSSGWGSWYLNAKNWFNAMGYSTEAVMWPTHEKVQSHIQSNETAMFYELAHGSSTSFWSGCTESTSATEIKTWIADYPKMPFTFIGSCDGMCNTGNLSLSYAFRKGSTYNAVTVGYCGMSSEYCAACWSYSVSWQTALFKYMNQSYTVKQAFDLANANYPTCAANNCTRFAGDENFEVVPVVKRASTTPPMRLNGQPTGNLSSGTKQTTISLTTNEAATCKYSTTAGISYDSMTNTFSTTGNNSHSQLITGLTDGNTYRYYVKCSDSSGNKNTDDYLISFGVSPDTTLPTISISSPANGATVSGTITISASASDNTAVTKVEFYLDGDLIGTDTASPYSMSWDTTLLTDGSYTLQAKAYDAAGNAGSSSFVTVTVSNIIDNTPPTVLITYPADGSTFARRSKVTITATATDNVAVAKVEFYVKGKLQCVGTTGPYTCNWNVPSKPSQTYQLQAKAYDAKGNTALSAIITVRSS